MTGLPSLTAAEAAPKGLKPGKRCDEMFSDLYDFADVVEGSMPDDGFERNKSDWDEFDYVNGQKQWDGLREPTQAELDGISDDPDDYKKGDKRRVWAYWKRAKATSRWKNASFTDYRDDFYIPQGGHDPRGRAYMAKLVHDRGLVGPDWICEKEIEVYDPDTKKTYVRRLDAYNTRTEEVVEGKSNNKPDRTQRPKDIAMLKDPAHKGKSLTYAYGQEPKGGAKNHDEAMRKIAPDRVKKVYYRSDAVENAPKGTQNAPTRRVDPYMNAKPGTSTGSRGGGNDLINRSAPTPEDMKKRLERIGKIPSMDRGMKGPGGVDFTTMDLQYVGKPVKGQGLDYSFAANEAPEGQEMGWGGKTRAQLISDSFFTWLALTPDKFWVNLNPDQPGKVMDTKFGKTDAGRVLLEADLEMKHDFAEAVNPDKHAGAKRYWDTAPRRDGIPCFPGVRMWISPETAKVRQQDGGIYILDAPLKVDVQWLDVDYTVPGSTECKDLSDAEKTAIERSISTNVMPVVEERINKDAAYADLRAVYTARVAAEYIRQQDAQKPTDYRKIINSDDASAWPLRAPNQEWTREGVWDRYMKSIRDGVEWFELRYGGKVYNQGVGGVDFSKQPKRNVSQAEFRVEHPYRPRQTRTSVKTVTNDTRTDDLLLLGGNSAGRNDEGHTTPTPTPTPTGTGKPTGPPSSPAPDPTTPGPGDTGKPTPPAGGKDPGGDLAGTGSDTPVGLIAGVAAALAVAGGALMWWMRRRKAAQE
ncbi:hypothetical protein [Streptomyces sp. NPDC048438]|uniref:hypothetical protein n=1 Tax=Streptomyces sp. NPDC048438 TaxID=3365551 RepID=UPI0037209A01